MSQPLSALRSQVAEKLRFQEYAATYGFKIAYPVSERSSSKKHKHTADGESDDPAPFATKDEWLKLDETLSSQGIRDGDAVVLLKRFVHRSPSPPESVCAADEHMSFSLARSQILSGVYDDHLFMELQVELAAILLLHSLGRYTADLSPNYVHENKSSILSPKWRKKFKADVAAHIITTHMALSNLPWAFDPRGVKQQLLLSMFKIPSYGVSQFKVECVRNGMHTLDDAIISISSSRISARKNKSSTDSTIDVAIQSIEEAFVMKRSVAFVFAPTVLPEGSARQRVTQEFSITSSRDSGHIVEAITGYKAAWDAAQAHATPTRMSRSDSRVSITSVLGRGMQPSASTPSLASSSSSATTTSKKRSIESLESDAFLEEEKMKIDAALSDLQSLVMGSSRRSRRSRHQSLNTTFLGPLAEMPAAMFTQAATHLSSVSRGLSNMVSKIRSGPFFQGAEWRKSEAIVSQWCTAICSTATCVSEAGNKIGTGIQAIAFTARMLLVQAKSFVAFLGSTRAAKEESRRTFLIRTELSIVEKAVLATCAALDLALQDKLCDESSACCLFVCCADIDATSNQLLTHAKSVIDRLGDETKAATLRSERQKSAVVFSWYQRLFCAAASVPSTDNDQLSGQLSDALESYSSSANALLAATLDGLEKLADGSGSPKADDSNFLTPSAVKNTWGSLTLSIRCFSTIFKSASQPLEQVDPMLPPVLFQLNGEIWNSMLALLSPAPPPISRVIAQVASQASGVVRTLAVQASVEPSPTIILQSAMIESALEKLKSNAKPVDTPQNFSRVLTVQQSLAILDAALVTVADSRVSAKTKVDGLIAGFRLLMLSFLQLRSTLRFASGLPTTKMVDGRFVGRYLERLDPIIDEALPLLASGMLVRPNGSFSVTHEQVAPAIVFWTRELKALSSKAEMEKSSLGVFAEILSAQRKRLQKRIESVQLLLPLLQVGQQPSPTGTPMSGRSLAKGMKRLSSVRQILMRPSATSFSLMRVSEGSELAPDEVDADDDAVRETGSQGTLAYSNESGLLQLTKQLILEGTAPDISTHSFTSALQICVLTHPYWTVPDAFIGHVISPYATLLSSHHLSSCSLSLLSEFSLGRKIRTPVGVSASAFLLRFLDC
jgi:hypothetical protein